MEYTYGTTLKNKSLNKTNIEPMHIPPKWHMPPLIIMLHKWANKQPKDKPTH